MKLSELCPVPLPPANLPSEVLIGPGVLDEVEAVAARHMSADRLILADPDTWRAVGEPSLTGTRLLLEPHPHADDETVARVVDAMKDRSGIVAVGSGTINDLAKRAAHLLERPYIIVGTAASMNGYASGIAAILSNSLKTTVPAAPPRAIIPIPRFSPQPRPA